MSEQSSNDAVAVAQGDLITRLLPAGTQMSFGAMSGVAAGYAMRQGGKVMGALLGGGFMFVQSLAYMGYVEVDWRKVERDYGRILDRNKDGKVTAADFQMLLNDTTELLKFNLPAGSGFAAGFTYGLSGSLKIAAGSSLLYGGVTSAALGGVPYDLFTQQGLTKLANDGMAAISGTSGMLLNAASKPIDRKAALASTLNGRTIDELRQLEFEVKHDIGVTRDLLGIKALAPDRDELLEQIEASKKFVKGH